MYRRILVGHDGSTLAALAARHALGLARAVGAALEVVHVSPPFAVPAEAHGSPFEAAMRAHAARSRKAARAALEGEFTPLSDHRSGADYRRKLAGNLFAKFLLTAFLNGIPYIHQR